MRDMTVNLGGDEHIRPDWVMCGAPCPRGVRLLASKELTHADLEYRAGFVDVEPWDSLEVIPKMTSRLITLTAGMRTFLLIEAPDYPSAFRALFAQWAPGPGDQAALPTMLAIEGRPHD